MMHHASVLAVVNKHKEPTNQRGRQTRKQAIYPYNSLSDHRNLMND